MKFLNWNCYNVLFVFDLGHKGEKEDEGDYSEKSEKGKKGGSKKGSKWGHKKGHWFDLQLHCIQMDPKNLHKKFSL